MLDTKSFDKKTFDFDARFSTPVLIFNAGILYVLYEYGTRLLGMTGSYLYVTSLLTIFAILVVALLLLLSTIALKNRPVQILYAIIFASASIEEIQKLSLVGEYDLRWWGAFIALTLAWTTLLYFVWRHRIIRQSSQCILGTIILILLIQPVAQTVSRLYGLAF